MKILAIAVFAACLVACGGGGGSSSSSSSSNSSSSSSSTSTLQATVGPGYTIALTQDGKKVTSLKAGSYEIKVDDHADIHDFHLTGPGVDKATSVPEQTTTTWKVTLAKGSYSYVCDPHSTLMNGSFTVT